MLAHDDLTGDDARNLAGRRRRQAADRVGDEAGPLDRLEHAPRAYVLRTPSATLAEHARLLDPKPAARPRLALTKVGDRWRLDVAWQDRPGLLAALTHALTAAGVAIDDAVLATWPDGAVLDSFVVRSEAPIDTDVLALAIDVALEGSLEVGPSPDATVELDQGASPWHTVCEVRMEDRPGVLAALASAFAAAGIEVKAASVSVQDGLVVDRFEVTDRAGGKLTPEHGERFRSLLRTGSSLRRRRLGRGLSVKVLA